MMRSFDFAQDHSTQYVSGLPRASPPGTRRVVGRGENYDLGLGITRCHRPLRTYGRRSFGAVRRCGCLG